MKFTLEIELGNDAIQNAGDLAALVSRTADSIITYYEGEQEPVLFSHFPQPLRDLNGNTVGKWEVIDTSSWKDCSICGTTHKFCGDTL